MKRLTLLCIVCTVFPLLMVTSQAQDIVIDWPTKSLLKSPSQIDRATTVVVSVRNVNDFLYNYVVDVIPTPRQIDDLRQLASIFTAAAAETETPGPLANVLASQNTTCATFLAETVTALKAVANGPGVSVEAAEVTIF